MPTYEYACKDCGRHFDIFQDFSEDSLTVCPECQGHLRKKFNSVGVVFKGSGFYRNDSRSTSVSGDAPAASSSADSSAASTPAAAPASSPAASAPAASTSAASSSGSASSASASAPASGGSAASSKA